MPGDTTAHRSRSGDPMANPLVDRLVECWEAGAPVPLAELLPSDPPGTLVADLACCELELRLRGGHPARAADYLDRFPALAADDDLALYLFEAEILARKAVGPPPVAGEFARFPHLLPRLERLIAGNPAPTLPDPPPGYVLTEEIGRGGMGVVYRARDLALKREVAVKVLLPRYAPTSDVARRFVEEAQITGQLQHPGVPAVHQVGALADGRPFLAMKLIKGRTLASLLADGARLNAPAVFEGVCQAVGYAHTRGVIHRDLKPDNVMVGAFGEVQVMDWGLGKVLSDSAPPAAETVPAAPAPTPATAIHDPRTPDRQDTTGAAGTPWYMSPEQAAGEGEKVGPRTDVFGLGGILCALLTGKPPIDGTSAKAALTNAIRGETAAALARLAESGAEPELVELCKRCLSADPAARPADAGEVAAAVAVLRAEAEERVKRAEAEKLEAAVREAEGRKRRTLARWAITAVLMALVVGTGVSIAFGLDARKQADEARTQKRLAEDAANDSEREKQAAKDARDDSQRALAKALLGPISAGKPDEPLTDYEQDAIWQLAELHDGPVGIMLLTEATRTPLAGRQFVCRAEFLVHAAVGLDSRRWRDTDALVARRLRDPTTTWELKRDVTLAEIRANQYGDAAIDMSEVLAAALGKATSVYERRALAEGLAGVAARMPADRAEEACGKAAGLLVDALGKERDDSERRVLAEGLAAVAARLPADRGAGLLADALSKATSASERHRLAEGLAAVAARMPADRAAGLLADTLAKATSAYERGALAEGLAAVAARMPADRAEEVCGKAAGLLADALGKAMSVSERRALTEGLAAVTARMPVSRAEEACGKAAGLLADALGKATSASERGALAKGLAAVASGLPEGVLSHHKNPEAFAAVAGVTVLHPDVRPKPRPLPPQKLVDLLKHPFVVGEARRGVLDALELTYDRQFANLWEFIAFAEKEHPELNLLTPPKRPAKK